MMSPSKEPPIPATQFGRSATASLSSGLCGSGAGRRTKSKVVQLGTGSRQFGPGCHHLPHPALVMAVQSAPGRRRCSSSLQHFDISENLDCGTRPNSTVSIDRNIRKRNWRSRRNRSFCRLNKTFLVHESCPVDKNPSHRSVRSRSISFSWSF